MKKLLLFVTVTLSFSAASNAQNNEPQVNVPANSDDGNRQVMNQNKINPSVNINNNNVYLQTNNSNEYAQVQQAYNPPQQATNTISVGRGTTRRSNNFNSSSSSSVSASFGTKKQHKSLDLKIKTSPSMKRFFNERFILHKNCFKKTGKQNRKNIRHCFKF